MIMTRGIYNIHIRLVLLENMTRLTCYYPLTKLEDNSDFTASPQHILHAGLHLTATKQGNKCILTSGVKFRLQINQYNGLDDLFAIHAVYSNDGHGTSGSGDSL